MNIVLYPKVCGMTQCSTVYAKSPDLDVIMIATLSFGVVLAEGWAIVCGIRAFDDSDCDCG